MLVGAAVALYPRLLPSNRDPSNDITIQKALSGPDTLHEGLVWWGLGMCLAVIYFVIVYHMFRSKVSVEGGWYGHWKPASTLSSLTLPALMLCVARLNAFL